MPKDINVFIQEKWNDPELREKFFKAKYRGKVNTEGLNWKGRGEGVPHPGFIKWLTEG